MGPEMRLASERREPKLQWWFSLWLYDSMLITHRIHGAGIYANIGGILMVNVTIYGIHGSYGLSYYVLLLVIDASDAEPLGICFSERLDLRPRGVDKNLGTNRTSMAEFTANSVTPRQNNSRALWEAESMRIDSPTRTTLFDVLGFHIVHRFFYSLSILSDLII